MCAGTGRNRHRAAQGCVVAPFFFHQPIVTTRARFLPSVKCALTAWTASWAARPAFNLNLNAVLFSSAADGGKTDAAVDSNLTEAGTGRAEWKLTLKDTDRSFNASASNTWVRTGENLTITYRGAGTGENEYVSAMIADSSNNILYYGRIAQNSANGTASVAIPSDLTAGTYTLKVFSEQYNGDYKTDYASEFPGYYADGQGENSASSSISRAARPTCLTFRQSDIPGTVNDVLPDKTMHYVPFTFCGYSGCLCIKQQFQWSERAAG